MKVNLTRKFTVLAVAAMTIPAGLATANAAATKTLVLWDMNEGPGVTVMAGVDDSGPNDIDGDIGSAVQTGVVSAGVGLYRWSNVRPEEFPAKPERLILATDDDLNPGTRDFAVSFRYRTSRPFGNITQKGQARTVGGNWKFQLPQGNVTCHVRGALGKRAVRTVGSYRDNQWHTVRCERTSAGIVLTVSDANGQLQETRKLNGPTGNLSNRFPISIGGKPECDQIRVTCDYFAGDIDWVKFEVSP